MGSIRIVLGILVVSAFLSVVASCASSTSPTTFTQLSSSSQTEAPTTVAPPTSLAPPEPFGDKAALLAEVERVRAGLKDGTLVADWGPQRDLPSDFQVLLDGLEKAVYAPDVTVDLTDSAGAATALYDEIAAMPEVLQIVYVSRQEFIAELKERYKDDPEKLALIEKSLQPPETAWTLTTAPTPATTRTPGTTLPAIVFHAVFKIWLKDYRQATHFANELWRRPEVQRAYIGLGGYPGWVELLKRVVHQK